jgi:hypothetical protein
MKGGSQENVISASADLIKSMKELGESIFTEIKSITNIKSDIDNGVSPTQSTPNISGPPQFSHKSHESHKK